MKKLLISVAVFAFAIASFAQAPGYEFTTVVSHKATPVKDQSSTGTCWCFATASFIESALRGEVLFSNDASPSNVFLHRPVHSNVPCE